MVLQATCCCLQQRAHPLADEVELVTRHSLLQRGDSPADYVLAGVPFAAVAMMKPQVILLADNSSTDGGQSPAVVAKRPGWAGIPAVKTGLIVPLNDDVASRWGPRLPQLVAEIAAAVTQAAK